MINFYICFYNFIVLRKRGASMLLRVFYCKPIVKILSESCNFFTITLGIFRWFCCIILRVSMLKKCKKSGNFVNLWSLKLMFKLQVLIFVSKLSKSIVLYEIITSIVFCELSFNNFW